MHTICTQIKLSAHKMHTVCVLILLNAHKMHTACILLRLPEHKVQNKSYQRIEIVVPGGPKGV